MLCTKLPNAVTAARIEREARRIDDPVARLRYLRRAASRKDRLGRIRRLGGWVVVAALAIPMVSDATGRPNLTVRGRSAPTQPAKADGPAVWVVESTRDYEIYSNGLRIESRLTVAGEPRSYRREGRAGGEESGEPRTEPAGIVYHTTESDQAPFRPDETHALKRIGQELLHYVRNKQAYHYVIDRFGRVHRIVAETDKARHAGHSVWADSEWAYVDLNGSFLGVAFEARMHKDPPVNRAQIHASKILTEMLRSKYHLSGENCVTHAQVSVNPYNMRVGWHTDWGSRFPFHELGLPDNYQQPLASLYLFGFEYDQAFVNGTGSALWRGLAAADEQLREAATSRGLGVAEYRRLLQKRYRDRNESKEK
jgi:hypothetical protein